MKSLINKLHNNDSQAFDEIYDLFHQKVYHFMLRYVRNSVDAQEMTQLLFIRLWEKRAQLKAEQPLGSQIFRIARNLTIDELRKKARQQTLITSYQAILPELSNCTEDTVVYHDLVNQYEKVVAQLPKKRKEIFQMSRKDGLTYREIAAQLSISIKTVENQMGKALQFLKMKMTSFLTVAYCLLGLLF